MNAERKLQIERARMGEGDYKAKSRVERFVSHSIPDGIKYEYACQV